MRSLEQHVALVETARTVAASLPSRTQLAPGEITGEMYGNRWRMGVSPFFGGASTLATQFALDPGNDNDPRPIAVRRRH